MLYQEARDSQGACTKHLCYGCWLSTDGDPSPEYFLEAQKSTSKWKYTCVEDDVWCNEDA